MTNTILASAALLVALLAATGTSFALILQRRVLEKLEQREAPFADVESRTTAFSRVLVGQPIAEVLAAVGPADEKIDSDWYYQLDDHSGYVVQVDASQRVAAVRSWKS
jgi:hypothetical protein